MFTPPTQAKFKLHDYGMLLVCAILWAGQAVAVKVAVHELLPWSMVCWRVMLSCAVVGVAAWVAGQSLKLEWKQWKWLVLNAAFLLSQIGLFTMGTELTTSVHSVVIINSFPFFTALFSHYFLADCPLQARTFWGLVASFIGVCAVFGDQLTWPDAQALQGDLYILFAAALMGGKITYVKALLSTISPWKLVFWEALLCIPVSLLIAWTAESWPLHSVSWRTATAVAYQGIAVSGIAFLLWLHLLTRHSPNDVTPFRLLTPVLGAGLGWLILHEPLTPQVLIGGTLLAIGLYYVAHHRLEKTAV